MFNPTKLTPELSKTARRELGLSQNEAIKACGIQAYKLKHWEARGLTLDLTDLRKLADFYTAQGVNLAELAGYLGDMKGEAGGATTKEPRTELQAGFTHSPRPGFVISSALPASLVDGLMERMEANDDRIGDLTQATFQAGFFGGISDDTEAKARELIGALAENHVIFRFLQGRNIIAPTRDEPETLGGYLAQLMKDSPALPLLVGGDQPNRQRAEGEVRGAAVDATE